MKWRSQKGKNIFEESRMMLPEHREELRLHRERARHRERPVLIEDELEAIGRALAAAMIAREPVTLRVYNEMEDVQINGIIQRIDQQAGRIKIATGDETLWMPMGDVVGVE